MSGPLQNSPPIKFNPSRPVLADTPWKFRDINRTSTDRFPLRHSRTFITFPPPHVVRGSCPSNRCESPSRPYAPFKTARRFNFLQPHFRFTTCRPSFARLFSLKVKPDKGERQFGARINRTGGFASN